MDEELCRPKVGGGVDLVYGWGVVSSKGWGWGGFGVWMGSCVVQRLGVGHRILWIWCMDEELCRPKVGGGAQDIVDLVYG